jgi:aryl-alcohol dehydrogenase-like predicted oxidoreductase
MSMEYRKLGSLKVSVVGMGCNQLGTAACEPAMAERVVAEALDAGIAFFDTSDEYGRDYLNPADTRGWGRSEEILGRVLGNNRAGRRDKVIIATKFGPLDSTDTNPGGIYPWERSEASARGVKIAAEESLKRLGTDYIDLYQLHFPDRRFPVDETLTALDKLVRDGKVREIGCCNFSAEEMRSADKAAKSKGLHPFASNQCPLNVMQRGAVEKLLPTCEELGLSFIPYYPLASGVLTGKYKRGAGAAAGTRLAEQVDDQLRAKLLSNRTYDRVEALEAYARERGRTLLELAFGWLLAYPQVATVIAGAAKPEQARSNGGAGGWRMTTMERDQVTAIVAGK